MKKLLSFALIICHLSSQLIASQDENKELEYGAMPVAPFPYVAVPLADNVTSVENTEFVYTINRPVTGTFNFFVMNNCINPVNQSSTIIFVKFISVTVITITLMLLGYYRVII